ncbi:MAG TPA: hypothetical protein VJ836_06120 [Candidatus Saccharimonadales bacterium]|nr:hypothetical protein [Candidatus Saccharimonadales bacterium]
MINISQAVEERLTRDDVALIAAQKGWLNFSSYARAIQPELQRLLHKNVQEGSIVTALSRIAAQSHRHQQDIATTDMIQSLSVHSNLEGMTYERTTDVSAKIRDIYQKINVDNKTYLTVTQGMNEVTVVAEPRVAQIFRDSLDVAHMIYDKRALVGITAKFTVGNLEVPNLIFALTRRLAYKNINIIEIVSTATEITYMIEKKDLAIALEQLQKDI